MAIPRRADARFLLPAGPHRVLLLSGDGWEPGLRLAGWDVTHDPAERCDVAVVDPVRLSVALASTAETILVEGSVHARGWSPRSWTTVLRRDQPVAIAPAGDPQALRLAVRAWEPADRPAVAVRRTLLAVPTDRVLPGSTVLRRGDHLSGDALTTVAERLGAPMGCRPVLLVGGGSERRRVTALFLPPRSRSPKWVLKAERFPSGEPRGAREKEVTEVVRGLRLSGVRVPRVLAVTSEGPDGATASLEDAAPGIPLRLRLQHSPDGLRALSQLSRWLVDLAAATSGGPLSAEALAHISRVLAGSWRPEDFIEMLDAVAEVPSILVHGDLVDGGNVLVDDGAVAVVDWETCRRGLPLLDLLPALGHGLALARVGDAPAAVAREVLRCAAGDSPDSHMLAQAVHALARRLALDPGTLGPLGALAWMWHGAQPALHRRELAAAGIPATTWDSTAQRVAEGWLRHPGLGLTWSALQR